MKTHEIKDTYVVEMTTGRAIGRIMPGIDPGEVVTYDERGGHEMCHDSIKAALWRWCLLESDVENKDASAPDDPDGLAAERGQRPHFDNDGYEICG